MFLLCRYDTEVGDRGRWSSSNDLVLTSCHAFAVQVRHRCRRARPHAERRPEAAHRDCARCDTKCANGSLNFRRFRENTLSFRDQYLWRYLSNGFHIVGTASLLLVLEPLKRSVSLNHTFMWDIISRFIFTRQHSFEALRYSLYVVDVVFVDHFLKIRSLFTCTRILFLFISDGSVNFGETTLRAKAFLPRWRTVFKWHSKNIPLCFGSHHMTVELLWGVKSCLFWIAACLNRIL